MPVSIPIHSNIRDYQVTFQETPDFVNDLAALPGACHVVDENVWKLYAKTWFRNYPEDEIIILPIAEDRKNLVTVQVIYDRLVERPEKRNLTLVSFGGGILQDITGFAVSTIYRGIKWIYIPTTLLAQADSCVGSKTSLNYGKYKNLLGTFYPPTSIHIFPDFLSTLPETDFRSGFGEVIKLHLMGGMKTYRELQRMVPAILQRDPKALLAAIQQSLGIKLAYMEGDEFDTGRRNLLNYGHDFGHALESTSEFAIQHGQAVIFGMLAANLVAARRGLITQQVEEEISESLLLPHLVVRPSSRAVDAGSMIGAMKKDKKRLGDNLALVMMTGDFKFVLVKDLMPGEVASVLEVLMKRIDRLEMVG
jgi:3-dehydroquinate synthase